MSLDFGEGVKISQEADVRGVDMEHYSYVRADCRARDYVEIAAKNYLIAEKMLDEFRIYIKSGCRDNADLNYREISHSIITTVVFSAFAAESFINDYSCKIMGDNFFYKNFQSLSVISKLQLCYKIVTGDALDTDSSVCYSLLKQLTKLRNDYAHNKSFFCDGMSEEEYTSYDAALTAGLVHELSYSEQLSHAENDLRKELLYANQALRALFELAVLFDAIDSNAHAEWLLFGSRDGHFEPQYLREVHMRFRS